MNSAQCEEDCTRATESTELFQDLLKRLNECHNKAMQELQLKVNKLKNERCLDALRLEEFYKKNQHLRENQGTLQESIKVLNERLQSGPCDRCRETEKQLENTSAFENLPLLTELQSERDMLKEENKKLILQLERLRGQLFQQTSFSEPEEGVIPDSPKQPLSFPVVNKMKRKRDRTKVRFAEKLSSQALLESNTRISSQTVVAESCHIDLNPEQMPESEVNFENSFSELKHKERNLPSCPSADEQNIDDGLSQTQSSKQVKQDPSKRRSRETEQAMSNPPCTSPCSPRKSPLLSQNCSPNNESWSMDPGAALFQYDASILSHSEPKIQTETIDLDYTFVSPRLLVAHGKEQLDQENSITGIGQNANDSLVNIFDGTGHEDYESCPQNETSALGSECVLENKNKKEEQQEEGMLQDEQTEIQFIDEEKPVQDPTQRAKNMSVACVVVTRKKAERRKLHGHTCKECELYYADLPEEQRKKKLSSCSRHRFLYIPPSTPENFWEVGFPSTQTCIERGYIREDNEGDLRLRRKQPYHATFSPKAEA